MRFINPWLLLILALASGTTAASLAYRYLREHSAQTSATEGSRREVAVASRDLAVGTIVTPTDVKMIGWPSGSVPVGYANSPALVAGRGVITPVRENEPLLDTKLADRGGGGGLPIIIREGSRAVSVKVDEVIGVAGFVLPGTRVDVLVTLSQNGGETQTKAILQNVVTLATGQSVERDRDGKAKTVTVITLLVSPADAERLTLASTQGRIQLALRNTLDTLTVTTNGARLSALSAASPVAIARPAARTERRVIPPAAPQSRVTVVEGYRGGERTLTTFESSPASRP